MLVDKIPWCSHKGDPIFSIHAQASGRRFATGGGDHCVKIWNLHAALDARQEENKSNHKLLATLTDHNGPVNVVRFSPSGNHLASGSDDTIACIFEYRPGSGGNVLGGEANVENWKTRFLLRGHSSHIVDLCWSPDGSLLATASLDSTVGIWDTSKGIRVHTITSHHSFVKGVAFDPVGTYLATFSEDKTIRIWKTEDWSRVATIKSPFQQMVTSTYACRMTWSPDGRYLLAGNSYQGATHAAVAVPREKWEQPSEYLLISGHGGVVVATAFNPVMFHVPPLGGGPPSQELSAIFALGSQDKRLTVWASSSQRPIFCGAKLFKSQALDVAWSPDGKTLLASSTDGTIACLQFDSSELGVAATRDEMTDVMKALYGSASGRASKRAFAESAEQLELEDRSLLHKQGQQQGQQKTGGGGSGVATTTKSTITAAVVGDKERSTVVSGEKKTSAAIAALDARLGGGDGGGRLAGAVTQTGFGSSSNTTNATTTNVITTRDATQLMPPPMPRPIPTTTISRPPAATTTTTTTTTDSEVDTAQQAKRAHTDEHRYPIMAPRMNALPIRPTLRTQITSSSSSLKQQQQPSSSTMTTTAVVDLELQATNINITTTNTTTTTPVTTTSNGAIITLPPRAEVSLLQNGSPLWTDVLCNTHIVAMTGTNTFSAIATADGHIILYTPAGRRIMPLMKIGQGIAVLTATRIIEENASRVLIVSTSGVLKVLHIDDAIQLSLLPSIPTTGTTTMNNTNTTANGNNSGGTHHHHHHHHCFTPIKAITRCSLSSLLEGNATVINVMLSHHGIPIVSMSDASVYIWQSNIEEWMRIADNSLTISSYGPIASASPQHGGEVQRAQSHATAMTHAATMPRVLGNDSTAVAIRHHVSRAHAEGSLAAAAALHSADEFTAWLVTYARALTESNDEGRLKELCDSLLDVSDGSMVLGMSKMKLLDDCVLPEMAKNRLLGGLLQRCRQAAKDIAQMMMAVE